MRLGVTSCFSSLDGNLLIRKSLIGGKITKKSPTAIEKETATGKINVFELEIQLDRSCIQKGNQCIPLNPGDTATAEAIVRQRRVIDYILDPFKDLQKDGLKL